MELQLFILGALLTFIGSLGLIILNGMKNSLDDATESIVELNVRVGVIVERTERHDKELEEIKNRQEATRERIHGLANDINSIKAKNYE